MRPEEEFIRWDWLARNLDMLAFRLGEHMLITLVAVVVGFAIAFPVALLIYRRRRLIGPILGLAGALYVIPSLALFGLLIPITGISLLTAEIALVSYTLLILVRNTLIGLDGVSPEVLDAADGLGLSAHQRLWRVELPLAVPLIVTGLRLATVTTIGLVAVTALIGQGGLGFVILTLGIDRFFATAIYAGSLLSVLLAVVADLGFVWLQRRLTPWSRAQVA
ncbi:MAG TPA: ABC transporter permease [Candidatus Limnocylindria bacterium]|nr:ABC transporter permease [Candidatus Limnocylindria bacterium]